MTTPAIPAQFPVYLAPVTGGPNILVLDAPSYLAAIASGTALPFGAMLPSTTSSPDGGITTITVSELPLVPIQTLPTAEEVSVDGS